MPGKSLLEIGRRGKPAREVDRFLVYGVLEDINMQVAEEVIQASFFPTPYDVGRCLGRARPHHSSLIRASKMSHRSPSPIVACGTASMRNTQSATPSLLTSVVSLTCCVSQSSI